MTNYLITSLIILSVLQFISFSNGSCIFLTDCPEALQLIERQKNDPKTVETLRRIHCGLEYKQDRLEAKIDCDLIPESEGCIPFSQCPAAMRLVRTRRDDLTTRNLLRSVACGNVNKGFILCENVTKAVITLRKPTSIFVQCGIQAPSSKIYMGKRANFEDYPWLALLQYKNDRNELKYRCHGSLINERYVLTAAHCLSFSSALRKTAGSLEKIVLGEYDISTSEDCIFSSFGNYCAEPVQEFLPESTHIHPDFLTMGALSDIALIRLNKKANFSDFVMPICLKPSILVKQHETLFISGWGRTEKGKMSTFKLKGKISLLSKSECAKFNIDKTQICAGSTSGTDTCKGDSGGPLMLPTLTENKEIQHVLIGVVSFGAACGSGSAVYTNVSYFYSWIMETIH